jgi:pantoate--beta-alanine ligase
MAVFPVLALPAVRSVAELRAAVAAARADGRRIGFVPTMGALHAGHVSLVELLKARGAFVAASIFVNPKQFAAHEDLGSYPRTLEADAAKLAAVGCDLLYAPEAAAMYPPGFATSVQVGGVSEGLESAARPHFFGGVATVVAKLLLQTGADLAAFGEKDYQQLLVVRRLARDLDIPVEIVAGETVREADGLAMSSRNVYLSPAERLVAGRFNGVLRAAVSALEAGAAIAPVLARCEAELLAAGFARIDYVALRDAADLAPLPGPATDRPARLLAAVAVGSTRLLDNFAVSPRP